MRLLLISNSTMAGQPYLEYPKGEINKFLGIKPVECVFIPYAAVTFSFNEYEQKVSERFIEIGHSVQSIHHFANPVEAIKKAGAIVVGGGNTWQLLRMMRENNLLQAIRDKVLGGTPYIGWSAGSNVACPTIKTTNDMPITDPLGFDALNLVPFQINPHYLDTNPENHAGETREQRILEFVEANKGTTVVGLREGTMILREDDKLSLIGTSKARVFKSAKQAIELSSNEDLSFLLNY
jgi:dipeptidase E